MSGQWNIIEMPDFDKEYLALEVDPFINFEIGIANFQFGLVSGVIYFEDSNNPNRFQFRWEGEDEMDDVWGTGSIIYKSETMIDGVFNFNNGDSCEFTASRLFADKQ